MKETKTERHKETERDIEKERATGKDRVLGLLLLSSQMTIPLKAKEY